MHIQKLHRFAEYFLKKHAAFLFAFTLPLAIPAGCGSAPSSTDDAAITQAPTMTASPSDVSSADILTPSAAPLPSATPTPSLNGYSPETAAELIRTFLDSEYYEISLVSDDFRIDSEDFYTFLISRKGSAIEPLILVNKETGVLKCILSDNTVQEITAHPLYKETGDTAVSWNGTYIILNEDGTLRSYIILSQTDDEHFEFTAYSYLDHEIDELSGVAQVSGREASFISESGASLHFSWSGTNLVLDHKHPAQTGSLTGIYSYTENQDSNVATISAQEAIERLSSLEQAQTGLAGSMADYFFYVQNDITIMNDRLCYNILVYSNKGNRLFYKAQFFVTLDGGTVYRQENSSDDVQIFSLQ